MCKIPPEQIEPFSIATLERFHEWAIFTNIEE
jgi:hypothetical protein